MDTAELSGPSGTERVAVVTGGGSGMGAAIARRLASRGHRVAVLDINGEAASGVGEDARG